MNRLLGSIVVIFFIFINYLLIIFFLKTFYLLYFVTLILVAYSIYAIKFRVAKNSIIFYISLLCISTFLFDYFDEDIFEIYLFLNLDEIYSYVGGVVSYILAILHSFILFWVIIGKRY